MNKHILDHSGASLIATVLVLLIFALFISIAVSIITTGSNISLQEEQGTQALFIADGGLQFGAMFNFPNQDGGLTPVNNEPLGAGSFSLTVPALSTNIDNAVTTIDVSSTNGFQAAPDGNYWIMLCDNITGSDPRPNINASTHYCEKISFPDTSFTGGTRGRHSSVAAQHLQNAVAIMYSWDTSTSTTLNQAINNIAPKVCVVSASVFTIPGVIQIADSNSEQAEDIYCSAIGTPAVCSALPACPGQCLTGCIRNAYSNGSGYAHNNGTALYQSQLSALTTSTGTISNVLAGSITRRVQAALEALQ